MPDPPDLIQEFIWQTDDITPELPRVHKFLNYWKENIDAALEALEVKKMQEVYLDSLVEATNLTKKQLKSFMRRKTNVYLTAEEAIKYGIADKILE